MAKSSLTHSLSRPFLFRGGLIWVVLVAGCGDNPAQQLRKDNPFDKGIRGNSEPILIVTCGHLPLELPGHIDVTTLPFWRQYSLDDNGTTGHEALRSGFTADQIRSWRRNGLELALAPMSFWKDFADELVNAGGKPLPSKTAVFRNARQVTELPAYWVEQPYSVFVSGSSGSLKGYTVVKGDCFFRINCVPGLDENPINSLHIKIEPVFRFVETEILLAENEQGFLRRRPEIVFDQLTLSGTLRNGWFLAIARRADPERINSPGDFFLLRETQTVNHQLVFLLTPRAGRTVELKTKK